MLRTIVFKKVNTIPLAATHSMPRQTGGSKNMRMRAWRRASAIRASARRIKEGAVPTRTNWQIGS